MSFFPGPQFCLASPPSGPHIVVRAIADPHLGAAACRPFHLSPTGSIAAPKASDSASSQISRATQVVDNNDPRQHHGGHDAKRHYTTRHRTTSHRTTPHDTVAGTVHFRSREIHSVTDILCKSTVIGQRGRWLAAHETMAAMDRPCSHLELHISVRYRPLPLSCPTTSVLPLFCLLRLALPPRLPPPPFHSLYHRQHCCCKSCHPCHAACQCFGFCHLSVCNLSVCHLSV